MLVGDIMSYNYETKCYECDKGGKPIIMCDWHGLCTECYIKEEKVPMTENG